MIEGAASKVILDATAAATCAEVVSAEWQVGKHHLWDGISVAQFRESCSPVESV